MKYIWKDYEPGNMGFIESWVDEETANSTGLDEGFDNFYRYWSNDENTKLNENFWCKVVYEKETPLAVIAFSFYESKIIIMEFIVDVKKRSKGIGTDILREFINNGKNIFGYEVEKSEAVIYPSNKASQKAFERAGYVFCSIHNDNDAYNYVFLQKTKY